MYSESRHFCAVVGRTDADGIYHGGDLPEGSGDTQEAVLPRAVLSSFNPAARISFGTSFFRHFFLLNHFIVTASIFFPHLGQFVEKGVGTGDEKGSCYDENDRWPEKSAASSKRASGMEWSGDFDLDAQNGK